MDKIVLEASSREETGKKNRSLRASGQLPAVVYGRGQSPKAIKLDARGTERVYNRVGSSKIISLKVDSGQAKNVLIQDVQQDGRTGHLLHLDFYLVRMDEKIRTEVPLHFIGESTAVYQQEGTLVKNLEALEIEALPADLPEAFEVDISVLDDFDKTIHVSDLQIPSEVELITEPEELVAKVEPPRSDEELAELDEEVEEKLPEDVAEEGTETGEAEAGETEQPAA